MTDMCLRIDGLPQATKGYTLLPFQGVFAAINLPRVLPWAMGCCPFGACSKRSFPNIWNLCGFNEYCGGSPTKPTNRTYLKSFIKHENYEISEKARL